MISPRYIGPPITEAFHKVSLAVIDQAVEGEKMPKYLCLQRALPGGDRGGEKPSPAQMQAMYAKFNDWRDKFQKSLTDVGGRLGAGRLVALQPAPDGLFVEVKDLIGGYMIVSAASLEEVIQIARECPGLVRPGSGVEVIEIHTP
jgi:hypothetical protein